MKGIDSTGTSNFFIVKLTEAYVAFTSEDNDVELLHAAACPVCRWSEPSKNTDNNVRFRTLVHPDEVRSRPLSHVSSMVVALGGA